MIKLPICKRIFKRFSSSEDYPKHAIANKQFYHLIILIQTNIYLKSMGGISSASLQNIKTFYRTNITYF